MKIVYVLTAVLILTAASLVGAIAALPPARATPALYFLNVGQGDSSLIELPGGVRVLIDGGPSGSVLLESLARLIPGQDARIDLVLMTHPQLDHFGGLVDVIKKYRVGAFGGTLRRASIAAYDALHEALEDARVPYVQLLAGDVIRVGEVTLSVLSPSSAQVMDKELNDTSLVVMLQSEAVSALYTGDIGAKLEESLARAHNLDADVLKVSHHGSRFSSSQVFLSEVAPAVAVIGVGKNSYGHPTKQTLERLKAIGAQIFRTDTEGSIKVAPRANQLDVLRLF